MEWRYVDFSLILFFKLLLFFGKLRYEDSLLLIFFLFDLLNL